MQSTPTTNEKTLTPVPLMQIATGFWASNALNSALELKLFDVLSNNPLTRDKIGERLGLKTRPLRMLLAAAASLGLLTKTSEGRYANSELAETFLVRGKPHYFGGFVEMLQKRLYAPWGDLTEALKTNEPITPRKSGPVFEYFQKNPEIGRLFTGAMHSVSSFGAYDLARKVDLSRHRKLLDVGGGSGAFCIELARTHPEIRCTIFDLSGTCTIAEEFIRDAELESRIKTHPGDFFKDDLPEGHDLILLSMIMHDWTPQEDHRILQKCFQALTPGGKIIVAELMMNDDETGPLPAALMSLNMLVELHSMNYTWKEYEEWLAAAGFKNMKRVPIDGAGCNGVIVAEKS